MGARKEPCSHGVLKGRCAACQRATQLARYHANPDKRRADSRRWNAQNRVRKSMAGSRGNYVRRYGITYAAAVAMREAQGNRCLICERTMTDGKATATRWCVDHYRDGRGDPDVRGILCRNCNVAIGQINDHDPAALRRAAEYIEAKGRAPTRENGYPEKHEPIQPQLRLIP